MEKATLPKKPEFIHIKDGWSVCPERWNYVSPGYAVVGRVYPAASPEHKGEFYFSASTSHPGREHNGYKPTLEEAKREVVVHIETNWEIKDRESSEVYSGA